MPVCICLAEAQGMLQLHWCRSQIHATQHTVVAGAGAGAGGVTAGLSSMLPQCIVETCSDGTVCPWRRPSDACHTKPSIKLCTGLDSGLMGLLLAYGTSFTWYDLQPSITPRQALSP